MPKGKPSNASAGASRKKGFDEKGRSSPQSGTRPRPGKSNLPLESRRKDNLPQPE